MLMEQQTSSQSMVSITRTIMRNHNGEDNGSDCGGDVDLLTVMGDRRDNQLDLDSNTTSSSCSYTNNDDDDDDHGNKISDDLKCMEETEDGMTSSDTSSTSTSGGCNSCTSSGSNTKRRRCESTRSKNNCDTEMDVQDVVVNTSTVVHDIPNFRRVTGLAAKMFRCAAPETHVANRILQRQKQEEEETNHKISKLGNDETNDLITSNVGRSSASTSPTTTTTTTDFVIDKVDLIIDLRFSEGEGGVDYSHDLQTMIHHVGMDKVVMTSQSSIPKQSYESEEGKSTFVVRDDHDIANSSNSTNSSYVDIGPIFEPPIFLENQQRQNQNSAGDQSISQRKRWHMTYLGDGTEEGTYSQRTLLDYMSKIWDVEVPSQSPSSTSSSTSSPSSMSQPQQSEQQRKTMLLQKMSDGGLVGLNELLLFHNTGAILTVLQTLTLVWEKRGRTTNILVNCTLGKDRTGIIVALCQYLVGMPIHDIATEYALSTCCYDLAYEKFQIHFHGQVDPASFASAPAHVMVSVFEYLKDRYDGRVNSYFDEIGFNKQWRDRFVAVAGKC